MGKPEDQPISVRLVKQLLYKTSLLYTMYKSFLLNTMYIMLISVCRIMVWLASLFMRRGESVNSLVGKSVNTWLSLLGRQELLRGRTLFSRFEPSATWNLKISAITDFKGAAAHRFGR